LWIRGFILGAFLIADVKVKHPDLQSELLEKYSDWVKS
jgi:hypothetical protein